MAHHAHIAQQCAVTVQKPSPFGIVIPTVQVIIPCLCIPVIPSVSERVNAAYGLVAEDTKELAPCVILVEGYYRACLVIYCRYVSLNIPCIVVVLRRGIALLKSKACQLSGSVIGKPELVFGYLPIGAKGSYGENYSAYPLSKFKYASTFHIFDVVLKSLLQS